MKSYPIFTIMVIVSVVFFSYSLVDTVYAEHNGNRGEPHSPSFSGTVSGNDVTLTWSKPDYWGGHTLTAYSGWIKPSSSETWNTSGFLVNAYTFTHTYTLETNEQYDFRVFVENNRDIWSPSPKVLQFSPESTTTPELTVPSQITRFSVAITDNSANLVWSAPTDNGGSSITSYVLEYKPTDSDIWSRITHTDLSDLSTTITGLDFSTQYGFKISAVNSVGSSVVSNAVFESTPQAPDTTPPIIKLTGNSKVTVFKDSSYTDAGASCSDDTDTTLSILVVGDNIDTSTLGTYTITYDCTDEAGNTAIQKTRIVIVHTTPDPPIITSVERDSDDNVTVHITPPNSMGNSDFSAYAVCWTNVNNNRDSSCYNSAADTSISISSTFILIPKTIDSTKDWNFTVTTISSSGESATESNKVKLSRKVITSTDNTPPVITLNGDSTITLEYGTPYTELGARTDDGSTIKTRDNINLNTLGSYTVTYDSTDSSSNQAIQVTRTVNVVDTTKPEITLEGSSTVTVEFGSTYTDAGATASDNYDNDDNITDSIVPVNPVNTGTPKEYTITYNVFDSSGNDADEVTRTVTVNAQQLPSDNTPPVITLNGDSTITLEYGTPYTELGATTDDGSTIKTRDNINLNTLGSYTVTYDSTDSAGNSAIQVTRTVNVVDTTKPVITLNGNARYTINVDDIYTDLGATCSDLKDGTIQVSIDGDTIDTSSTGTHTITYDCTDEAGNDATQMTRTVKVINDTPIETAPEKPIDVTVTKTDNYASLSWNEPDNGGSTITSYNVQFKKSSESSWSDLPSSQIIGLTANVYDLDFSLDNEFGVSAINKIGHSPFSSVTLTATSTLPPAEPNPDTTPNPETPKKKKSSGGNEWDTRPTFGLNHKTLRQVVECGFTFNDVCYDITDNWFTHFDKIQVNTGETNTAIIKVLAEKKLKNIEFELGIPEVGKSINAEVSIFAEFDHQGNITNFGINGDSDAIDNLHMTNTKAKCQDSDVTPKCDVIVISFESMEPLENDVIGLQAIDYKRRVQTTYLNEGINFSGDSLNPMLIDTIAGNKKYEGLITITQESKYSDIWVAEDGREFQKNEWGTFNEVNKVYEKPIINGRSGEVMQLLKQEQNNKALELAKQYYPNVYDESFGDMGEPFTYEYTRIDRADDPELQKAILVSQQRAAIMLEKIK